MLHLDRFDQFKQVIRLVRKREEVRGKKGIFRPSHDHFKEEGNRKLFGGGFSFPSQIPFFLISGLSGSVSSRVYKPRPSYFFLALTGHQLFWLIIWLCLLPTPLRAQITPDGTTSTTVDANGNNFTINDGDRAGGNLFHSFGEFSVPTGSEAFFNNATDVENIINRVTGGNISNIDGLIRASGSANLFLLNPAGIIFGPNARLNIGGSFFGSTADSLLFDDGTEFSATDLQTRPLLTINAPIGLSFRDNPGDIVNRSVGQNPNGETNVTGGAVGLQVPDGETLAIVGGNVLLDDGNLTAKGGHIEIGSVGGAGEVGITETDIGFVLDYDSLVSFGDITLQNTAVVDVTDGNGGSINLNGNNIVIDNSSLNSGIAIGLGSSDSQADDINIKTNFLSLNNFALIRNTTSGVGNAGNVFIEAQEVTLSDSDIITEVNDSGGMGNAGDININTNSLSLIDGSALSADTENQGNAGNVSIEARDTVVLEGRGEDTFSSQITSTVDAGTIPDVTGDAGNIEITTGSLSITDGGFVDTSTFGLGNGGKITINASESVSLGNEESDGFLFSNVEPGAVGNSGGVEINAGSLSITDGGLISTSTFGLGNGGKITINASESVNLGNEEISGELDSDGDLSSNVGFGAIGNSGGIEINTGSLIVRNSSTIRSQVIGQGNSGDIDINAQGTVSFDGRDETTDSFPSAAFTSVEPSGEGNGGNINIQAQSLEITNRAQLLSNVEGIGDAGDINIQVENEVNLVNSDIISEVTQANEMGEGGRGEGGDINITTGSLLLQNGSSLLADTENIGDAGNITIEASERVILEGEGPGAQSGSLENNFITPSQITATVEANASGEGGNINISAPFLSINDEGFIRVSTFGQGDAGTLNINTNDLFITDNGLISANTFGRGDAGGVTITTGSLSLTNGGQVNASAEGQGNAGRLTVQADSVSLDNNGRIRAFTQSGEGGEIDLQIAEDLTLRNNSFISARAFQEADGGNLNIDARFIVAFPSSGDGNDIIASAQLGDGGNINITAESLFGIEERPQNPFTNDIDASSEFGLSGNVTINTLDVNAIQETTELPDQVVSPETFNAQACNPDQTAEDILADRESSFTITGRGGLPSQPTDPLTSDAILVEGEFVTQEEKTEITEAEEEDKFVTIVEQTEPVNIDEIVPARGMIVKENGEVILVGYPTANSSPRTPTGSTNCN